MPNQWLATAIRDILDERKLLDPKNSVPVYDLHHRDGQPTDYCLVRADWLDALWRDFAGDELLPHDHLDPSSTQGTGAPVASPSDGGETT